jgi:hypothetical protein
MSDETRGGPKPNPKGTLLPNPSTPGVQTPNKPEKRDAPPSGEKR